MQNRLLYLFFLLTLLSSCNKSLIGTHYAESTGWFSACLNIQEEEKFHYSESHDQGSFEGSGSYTILDNQLILNFGNNKELISDSSIKRIKSNNDTLTIIVFNMNNEPFRMHYTINSPIDNYDIESFILLKANESLNIDIPFLKNTELSIYTKKHKKVSYVFKRSGLYTLRHIFVEGPQFDISNTTWTFDIIKRDNENIVLKNKYVEGFPSLNFRKSIKDEACK